MKNQASSTPRDNLLGICHAIGEAFGFNPLFLRIALAIALLFDFELTIGIYAALGLAVLAGSLIARAAGQPARLSAAT